jgi:hypothetical protein
MNLFNVTASDTVDSQSSVQRVEEKSERECERGGRKKWPSDEGGRGVAAHASVVALINRSGDSPEFRGSRLSARGRLTSPMSFVRQGAIKSCAGTSS